MTEDMQRSSDLYQVPPRVLQELAENAARRAVEEATPRIAEEAAKRAVELAFDDLKKQAGGGLFHLAKYLFILMLLSIAAVFAYHGKIQP